MADKGEPVVAQLGTGIIGEAMARNALRAGLRVRVWNRTSERAQPLADDGAEVAPSPAAAADGADLIVTTVTDADAVLAVVDGGDGALEAAHDGAIWVQSSTVGIEGIERCIELADRRGIALVDAPILGTKQPAQKGELVVLAAGPDDARERCEPFFEAIGSRTLWLGEAGQGTRLKLVTNCWVVAAMEGLAETFALAEGLGLDPSLFLEAISGGGLDIPYAHLKGKAMIERAFEPAFPLSLALKDAKLLAEAAESQRLDLPLSRTIAARFRKGVEAGHGDDDIAATYLTSTPERS